MHLHLLIFTVLPFCPTHICTQPSVLITCRHTGSLMASTSIAAQHPECHTTCMHLDIHVSIVPVHASLAISLRQCVIIHVLAGAVGWLVCWRACTSGMCVYYALNCCNSSPCELCGHINPLCGHFNPFCRLQFVSRFKEAASAVPRCHRYMDMPDSNKGMMSPDVKVHRMSGVEMQSKGISQRGALHEPQKHSRHACVKPGTRNMCADMRLLNWPRGRLHACNVNAELFFEQFQGALMQNNYKHKMHARFFDGARLVLLAQQACRQLYLALHRQ